MKALRKKATELEITTPQNSPVKTPNKRAAPATPASANKKARGKKGALSDNKNNTNNDDDDDNVAEAKKNLETVHLSSDEAEVTNTPPETPTKTTNGGKANATADGDDTTSVSTPSKRKTPAKPRAPRAKSMKAQAKPKAKKEALSPLMVEERDLEDSGVEMQFIKEEGKEIKVEDDENEKENEDALGGGVRIGVGEGQEKLSNGHAVVLGQSYI